MHRGVNVVCVGFAMVTSLKDAFAEFTAKRDILLAEATRLREETGRVDAELKKINAILENLEAAVDLAGSEELDYEPRRTRADLEVGDSSRRRELTPDEVVQEARQVILDGGRPLKRGAIVRAIEARGLIVPGSDKAKNLGTILWRADGLFANIKGYGYWPADVDFDKIYKSKNIFPK